MQPANPHPFKRELDDAFRYSAWEPSPEFARRLDDLRLTLGRHLGEHPLLLTELEAICAEGERARELGVCAAEAKRR